MIDHRHILGLWLMLAGWLVAACAQANEANTAWQLGSVTMQPCQLKAQHKSAMPSVLAFCATVVVPEDHSHPSGRQIGLHVAVIKAASAKPAADAVLYLDGGPGGAATETFPDLLPALNALQRTHHIVLIDQRGTGQSNPLICAPSASEHLDERVAKLQACTVQLEKRADLRFYTTTDTVQDVEWVRKALHIPTWNVLSISYGTRVAQQYMKRYPQALRAVVLDSPIPNSLPLLSEHAQNLDDVLRAYLQRCFADAPCRERYGNPWDTLKRVRAKLGHAPVRLEVHDATTFSLEHKNLSLGDFAMLLRMYTYSPVTSALLPYVIDEADKGRFAPLLSQALLINADIHDRIYNGLEASVLCAEDADLLHDNAQDALTLMGSGVVSQARELCRYWPHGQRPPGFHDPIVSPIPSLVLSGQMDPVTPPRYGLSIASGLSQGRWLTLKGQGHAVSTVGCMPRLIKQFFQTANAQAIDTSCLDELGDTAPFLSVNGAAP